MNSNMHKAKKAKNNEFYTKYETVEKELVNYKSQLENKIVYCNCDDYRKSNFYKYFKDNFENLKLKQLIATNYDIGKGSYKCVYEGKEEKISRLSSNGDFRSKECIELLDYSDIVITNPPFSLFREYIAQIMEYEKDFLVIGNMNAVTYRGVFPLIKDDRLRLGYSAPREFNQPDGSEKVAVYATWFTNLTTKKRLDFIPLSKSYYDNIDEYPKYDNYDAIEVSRVKNIPKDYEGVMGVPITFLTKYNPNQFDIMGMAAGNSRATGLFYDVSYSKHDDDRGGCGVVDGKRKYARILIRNKNPEVKTCD